MQPTTPSTTSAGANSNPRKRLSLYTHATLSHDLSQALKASTPRTPEAIAAAQVEAPPPSPIDFAERTSYFDGASFQSNVSSAATSRTTSTDSLYTITSVTGSH